VDGKGMKRRINTEYTEEEKKESPSSPPCSSVSSVFKFFFSLAIFVFYVSRFKGL
jgi:hypothetical protein